MKNWLTKAFELLKASLEPPRHELNELDWKAALSPDKKRLTEHLSAFANQAGGGFLVFGIDNTGTPASVDGATVEKTVNHLANLGREALEPPVALDHAVETYEGVRLLFVRVPESAVKPVHLLLDRLKRLLVINWRQKSSARSQVKLAIEDVLDQGLPRAYAPELYKSKCAAVFEHVYEAYSDSGASVYDRAG